MRAALAYPPLEVGIDRARGAAAVERGGDDEETEVPDMLGDEVSDDGSHCDERTARDGVAPVGEAEQPHLAVRHLRPRRVAQFALGLVGAWRLAGEGEEVREVGVEEAVQPGDVAVAQD
ncbi:MAG TPA: hypothetical protein VH041_12790, partial [Caldimonas sp.]